MGAWSEAILFGAMVVAFVLGVSSLVMGFLPKPAGQTMDMKEKVEYGFFGVSGLIFGVLLWLALVW